LEVGTGFHPELTGRENIYMNGAILGMRGGEIERKYDETCPERSRRIVAFAEIEKFLDTPVKHYSTGMYVRLAFAVAAHRSAEFILRNGGLTASMEPEILLVDEVLAMGGVTFGRGQTLPWVVSKRRNNADKKKDEK
jgi:lipopolysaccharide transport system ATP-binding protein